MTTAADNVKDLEQWRWEHTKEHDADRCEARQLAIAVQELSGEIKALSTMVGDIHEPRPYTMANAIATLTTAQQETTKAVQDFRTTLQRLTVSGAITDILPQSAPPSPDDTGSFPAYAQTKITGARQSAKLQRNLIVGGILALNLFYSWARGKGWVP